jgi:multicomponent Na+:H+ antiporter subunit E
LKKANASSIVSTFIVCYICWILFTWTFTFQELFAGALVSLAVAAFTARFFIHENPFHLFNIGRLGNLILYVFIFLKELWKANVDVAKRALNPSLPVNPGIVKVPSELKSEYGLSMLANSITLTPGTITMDIVEENGKNYYYIHWIDVSTKDSVEAGEAIKGTLEKSIRRIFE